LSGFAIAFCITAWPAQVAERRHSGSRTASWRRRRRVLGEPGDFAKERHHGAAPSRAVAADEVER